MLITAKDTQGNEFVKTVTTRMSSGKYSRGLVICFGWPVEYCAEDLLKHYPYQNDMCIDMGGMNHKGSKVCISAEQMDRVVEKFILKKDFTKWGGQNETDARK